MEHKSFSGNSCRSMLVFTELKPLACFHCKMERRKYIWDCYAEVLLICGCFTCCSNHKNCRLVFVCVLYLSFLCMHGAICFSLTKNTKDEICNLFITICISRKKVFLLQISQKNQLTADTPKRPAPSYKPDTQYTHISLSLTIFYPWRKIERIWKFFKMYSERLPGFFLWKECCIVERNHRKQTKIRKSFFPENEFSELESTFGSIHREDMSRDKTSIDCICVSSIIS